MKVSDISSVEPNMNSKEEDKNTRYNPVISNASFEPAKIDKNKFKPTERPAVIENQNLLIKQQQDIILKQKAMIKSLKENSDTKTSLSISNISDFTLTPNHKSDNDKNNYKEISNLRNNKNNIDQDNTQTFHKMQNRYKQSFNDDHSRILELKELQRSKVRFFNYSCNIFKINYQNEKLVIEIIQNLREYHNQSLYFIQLSILTLLLSILTNQLLSNIVYSIVLIIVSILLLFLGYYIMNNQSKIKQIIQNNKGSLSFNKQQNESLLASMDEINKISKIIYNSEDSDDINVNSFVIMQVFENKSLKSEVFYENLEIINDRMEDIIEEICKIMNKQNK